MCILEQYLPRLAYHVLLPDLQAEQILLCTILEYPRNKSVKDSRIRVRKPALHSQCATLIHNHLKREACMGRTEMFVNKRPRVEYMKCTIATCCMIQCTKSNL